jgi:hypothetical protein
MFAKSKIIFVAVCFLLFLSFNLNVANDKIVKGHHCHSKATILLIFP